MSEFAVSVIIPALNMERYLGFALSTIMRQKHEDLEIVVVDAGSTDKTEAVVDAYRRQGLEVRLVGGSAMTPAAARNFGIELSKGNIIAFLDADDLWPSGKLGRQLDRLASQPRCTDGVGLRHLFRRGRDGGLDPSPDSRTETYFTSMSERVS